MSAKKSTLLFMVCSLFLLAFPFYTNAEVLKSHYKNPVACPQIEYLNVLVTSSVGSANGVSLYLKNDRDNQFFMSIHGRAECGGRRDSCSYEWVSSDSKWDVIVSDPQDDLGDDVTQYTIFLSSKRDSNLQCEWNRLGY